MKTISLKASVFIGFGIVLVLLIALSGMALRGNHVVGHDFSEYRQAARESLMVNEANTGLMQARLSVMQFRITHDARYATEVLEAIDALRLLKSDMASFIEDPDRRETINQLVAEIGSYETAFDQMVEEFSRQEALRASMTDNGRAARTQLSDIMSSAFRDDDAPAAYRAGVVQQHLMLARYYGDRFFSSSNPDLLERTMLELESARDTGLTLSRALQNPARRSLYEQFVVHLDDFAAEFEQAVDLQKSMDSLKAQTLDVVGPRVAAGYAGILQQTLDTQNTIGPRAAAEISAVSRNTMVLALIAVIVGCIAAFFIGRSIANSIARVAERMKDLAGGNLEIEIPHSERKDELGEMARALLIFQESGIEKMQLEREQAMQAERAEAEKRQSMNELADGFEASVNEVVAAVSSAAQQMVGLSQGMSEAADRANGRSSAVAAASEEASTNVETVAAASEEMTNSIAEVSERISQSATMTNDAARGAEKTTQTVSQLATSAQTIGDVVKLISDIAEQTNLLALNATIEAARAGEAGKGFAVVASEVKSLANQTAKATEQISAQVTGMQGDTDAVVNAIDKIGTMIQDLNGTASSIAAAVEQQHSATQEIARNTQQAADGTREVSANITEVSNAVLETGDAAREVLTASSQLASEADRLKDRVADFLDRIRAA